MDAPCSGISMLWGAGYLAMTCASLGRLTAMRTVLLGGVALVVVIGANVLRTAALVAVETNVGSMIEWVHRVVGMEVFVAGAFAVAVAAHHLGRPECAA